MCCLARAATRHTSPWPALHLCRLQGCLVKAPPVLPRPAAAGKPVSFALQPSPALPLILVLLAVYFAYMNFWGLKRVSGGAPSCRQWGTT